MAGNLATTNVLIGVMVALSVLQTCVMLGAAIAGYRMYRGVAAFVGSVEPRDLSETLARVNAILDDVKRVTKRVDHDLQRVESALHSTMDTAEAVGSGVRAKARWLAGAGRGLTAFAVDLLRPGSR